MDGCDGVMLLSSLRKQGSKEQQEEIPACAGMTMIRIMSIGIIALTLTSCSCMPNQGDSKSPGSYLSGCWAAAKGSDR